MTRALVNAEDAHLADIGVDRDFEDMRDDVLVWVWQGMQRPRLGAHCLQPRSTEAPPWTMNCGRVALQMGWGSSRSNTSSSSATPAPLRADTKQIGTRCPSRNACSSVCVQLARVHVTVVEVALDKVGVHLDHLFYQRARAPVPQMKNPPHRTD